MNVASLAMAAALLAACAPYPPPPAAWPEPPVYAPPVYAPPVHAPPSQGNDQCGASGYRWLIGRSHAEIPPRPAGALWRVVAQGDAMTRDLRPNRLNIIYDRQTHRVLEVWCG
ncbi:MAG TPA: peptidase inhibitor I78 [Caulobacteraceae bacterium]|jgi:hypothetical protein